MRHRTRTDAQHDRTHRRPAHTPTGAVGVAPTPDADPAGAGIVAAMATVPFAVAMAVSYPTAAIVVAAAVAGAVVQRRYDEWTEKRVGASAVSRG